MVHTVRIIYHHSTMWIVSNIEISGSHGGKYEGSGLLGCCAMQSGRNLPTAALIMDTPSTSETLVNLYQTAQHNHP
jgi:hypothetical protein